MKHRLTRWLQGMLLALLVGLTLYPFVFLLVNSFKDVPRFYQEPWWPSWPLHWDNHARAWAGLVPYLLNSLLVCGLCTLAVLALGLLAGYAFARYRFPGRELLYHVILAVMMVPGVLMLVPSFLLAKDLDLLDTYWVMILFYVSGGQVMAIFLLREAIEAMPQELFQAAAMDGAGLWQILGRIVIPLSRPTLVTVALITLLGTWNNFLWPLVTTSRPQVKVVTNGLMEFGSAFGAEYGVMFAGYLLASLPMLVIILAGARSFMRGVTAGAVKH